MKQRIPVLGSLAAVAGCLALVWSAPAGERGTAGKALTDAQFAQFASANDLAEINLSKIAVAQASSPEVKQFAQRMLTDHTKSSKMLIMIANKQGLALAPRMDEKHEMLMKKMAGLKGPEFDREYMKHQVMGHKKAASIFQAQAANGRDPELKAFAAKVLPTIQHHMKTAEEINGKLTRGGAERGR